MTIEVTHSREKELRLAKYPATLPERCGATNIELDFTVVPSVSNTEKTYILELCEGPVSVNESALVHGVKPSTVKTHREAIHRHTGRTPSDSSIQEISTILALGRIGALRYTPVIDEVNSPIFQRGILVELRRVQEELAGCVLDPSDL